MLNFTDRKFIKIYKPADKFCAIEELAELFQNTSVCDDLISLKKALKEREDIMSTGIGYGIAIPHAKIKAVKKMSFAIGVVKDGLNFEAMDGNPVFLVLLVVAGDKQHKEYLKLLSNIMSIIKKETVKDRLIASESADQVFDILKAESV